MFDKNKKKLKKRILFVGMPDTAYTTLFAVNKAGANVVGVVTPPKPHPTCIPFAKYAQKMGYKVFSPEKSINEDTLIDVISSLNVDLAIVTSYSQKFSEKLLSTARDGFVNVHPSLLPEYRGANPYSHVIINGEKYTGVSIHKMDKNFDTGNILIQNQLPIAANDTMGTIFNKLNRLSGELLIKLLQDYEVYGMQPGVEQSLLPAPVHIAPKILPESSFSKIDWSESAENIERFIRGLNPFLAAFTTFKGITLKVYTADVLYKDVDAKPGTVCATGKTIDVVTGKGVLRLRSMQLGSFFVGDSGDFTERINVQVGDVFGD